VRVIAVQIPELQADAEKMLADAQRLLGRRNRVVHSVVASDLDPDSRLYEAWHAKTDVVWSVVPADLSSLAGDLERCARDVDTFGATWEERAESANWPDPLT
jgi:hypothetical protein